jgi:Zn-dependent peptidase ImmA (M78 family)
MTLSVPNPDHILNELGIRDPEDLDVEAIAEYCGATIKYKLLQGCEARILGYKDRAIITVNSTSPRERQRFSAGHELGHWIRDRGQVAFQCEDKNFTRDWSTSVNNPETRANRFASDLLLPSSMFRPRSRGLPVVFASVKELAAAFRMSLTATAIRFVTDGWLPSMLVANTDEERAWFVASPEISRRFWPLDRPGNGTIARALQIGGNAASPGDVKCSEWISHPMAHKYWIKEDSFMLRDRTVLSLLWWEDERQLIDQEEYEERTFAQRSDRKRDWD